MKVHASRLLAIVEGEPAQQQTGRSQVRRFVSDGTRAGSGGVGAVSGSTWMKSAVDTYRATPVMPGPKEDAEECNVFDVFHSDKGFANFERWYRRILPPGAPPPSNEYMQSAPLGWPQLHCPPNLLHEHAFLELVRTFVDCMDSEVYDLFDMLDAEFLGMLGMQQVYIGLCILTAIGCNTRTKLLYFHSSRIFSMLAKRSQPYINGDLQRISWSSLVTFLRLLGANGHLISIASHEYDMHPLKELLRCCAPRIASFSGMARVQRYALLCLLFGALAWNLLTPFGSTFCGGATSNARTKLTQRPGWRLDMMEVGPQGIGKLVIHEGYFIGELGFEEIQSQQGRRYRMRATKEEMEAGIDVDPITQIGPLKIRLAEAFGGSGQIPGVEATRPEGYRGIAGAAGWGVQDVPKKGPGFDPAPKALL